MNQYTKQKDYLITLLKNSDGTDHIINGCRCMTQFTEGDQLIHDVMYYSTLIKSRIPFYTLYKD